ncbi:histidine kinase [Hypnocyclicus thermotrophus]|uniref:Histidine kinase n=1 Tax=Hypnocyclicus thermotrophus TaxID=1627895 RepID=A0AA46I4Y9_9FUSO|nr:histidine kinase [Hypnocyclicus thermotrophus]TDT68011.1 histidine kinase [Hypnocyclicus thermotrophus]
MDIKKRKYFKEELKKKFIFYALLPTLFFSVFFYSVFFYYNFRLLKVNNKNKNKNISNILQDEFLSYESKINKLSNDVRLRKLIKKTQNKEEIFADLYKFINSRKIRSIFYVLDKDKNILITNDWKESKYNNKKYKLNKTVNKIKVNSSEITLIKNDSQLTKNLNTVYSIGKGIKEKDEIVAYIIFSLIEKDINSIIYTDKVEALVITDKFNNNIISTNNKLINNLGKLELTSKTKNIVKIGKNEYFYYKNNIFNDNIYVYSLTSLSYLKSFYLFGIIFMSMIFILLIMIFLMIAKKLAINQSKTVDELLYGIKLVQNGDLKTYINIKTNDEFEIIADYFNEMLDRLNKLINENKEQIHRNKMVEIKLLESQFNPHFLFNTLETIKYMVKISPENAIKVIVSLSSLLRYSINNKQEKIVLIEDITYIKDYLIIQKYRFENKLDYSINIEKDTERSIIPKLIIQPFIENSIKYGFEHKDNLIIELLSYKVNNNLIIKIIDNGKFIDEIKLKEINNILNNVDNKTDHIGIYNVHRRIKLVYGKKYGITIRNRIENDNNEGVEVKIKLPLIYVYGDEIND